jgi:16S rRNA processing protein RimM
MGIKNIIVLPPDYITNEINEDIQSEIFYKEKEVYIPLHEASLLKTDRKNRKVYVELPEGLLDIYL